MYRYVEIKGKPLTKELSYICIGEDGNPISYWKDIPLYNDDKTVNMVVEIPKNSLSKFEVSLEEPYNIIKQDLNSMGELRNYFKPIEWNYGMLPQTWENPNTKHSELGLVGDGDPVDVIEIGEKSLSIGHIYPVKILGVLGLIDDNELDWKIIAINEYEHITEDKLITTVKKIREWFRTYKVPEGKSENSYCYNGKLKSVKFAKTVIEETHEAFEKLCI